MPPRYAYWTILIDGKATAFRARERDELLPTFNQLARKNPDIVMRYFAKGRLWDNPEQAHWANRNPPTRPPEPRDREWRPGGDHKDPRARFDRSRNRDRKPIELKARKPFESRDRKPFESRDRKPFESRDRKPFESAPSKPFHPPGQKPFERKERSAAHNRPDKPYQKTGDRRGRPEPRSGAPPPKRSGGWRPPRKKPR